MLMKKVLHFGFMFLFVVSLGACSGGKQPAIEVKDATSKTRFAVSSDGVISDADSGLEWLEGPNQDTKYASATNWVANCKVAGGGWRMPTVQELKTLYLPGVGQRNMDPVFKTSVWRVWAESGGSSSMSAVEFPGGNEVLFRTGQYLEGCRVFVVRSRPQ
jgi:hypothetical protein